VVTASTEESTHFASPVVVVDGQAARSGAALTDGTAPVLDGKQALVFLGRDAEDALQ
jgi:hypothetical protein